MKNNDKKYNNFQFNFNNYPKENLLNKNINYNTNDSIRISENSDIGENYKNVLSDNSLNLSGIAADLLSIKNENLNITKSIIILEEKDFEIDKIYKKENENYIKFLEINKDLNVNKNLIINPTEYKNKYIFNNLKKNVNKYLNISNSEKLQNISNNVEENNFKNTYNGENNISDYCDYDTRTNEFKETNINILEMDLNNISNYQIKPNQSPIKLENNVEFTEKEISELVTKYMQEINYDNIELKEKYDNYIENKFYNKYIRDDDFIKYIINQLKDYQTIKISDHKKINNIKLKNLNKLNISTKNSGTPEKKILNRKNNFDEKSNKIKEIYIKLPEIINTYNHKCKLIDLKTKKNEFININNLMNFRDKNKTKIENLNKSIINEADDIINKYNSKLNKNLRKKNLKKN